MDEPKEVVLPFPGDVIERATSICKEVGFLGAYTPTKGVLAIRQAIARFIQERDRRPEEVDPENIFLTNGASDGINRVLKLVVAHDQVGVLVPVPQYPLYSATLTLLDAKPVPYCLDEDSNWSLAPDELGRAIRNARAGGLDVRAMVMINPGNPTGNVFDRRTLEVIVRTCSQEKLVLLADEVYQANVYAEKPFLSARRIALELGLDLELFSFHSTSKGLLGECSRRGGYFEAHGIDSDVMTQLLKLSSMSLSSNVIGQVMMGLLVDPPREGQPSYTVYRREIDAIYESLKRRGAMLADAFKHLEGVTCNPAEVKTAIHFNAVQGAMYLFPRFVFPAKLIEAAEATGEHPEDIYCLALLEQTGVCLVPGWGFGEPEGTCHIRSTFLPPESEMRAFVGLIGQFHRDFYAKYK